MEKEIFDTITDYIFSVQALVDRVNRMYTVKLEGVRISDSITHLVKRIDRVELEGAKLVDIKYDNSVSLEIREKLSIYILATEILIDRLENKKGDIWFAISQIEHYEDILLKELKNHVKQNEIDLLVKEWLPTFKNVKLNEGLLLQFKKDCTKHGVKTIEILTKMLRLQAE